MDRSSEVMVLLNRQQLRRGQGIPTLTVLAGPIGAAIHEWKQWSGQRPVAVISGQKHASDLVEAWVATAATSGHLRSAVLDWLAGVTGWPRDQIQRRLSTSASHDLRQALDGLSHRHEVAIEVCRHLIASAPEERFDSRTFVQSVIGGQGTRRTSLDAFAEIASLVSSNCPAILVIPPPGQPESVARHLVGLVAAAPALPAAIAISEETLDNLSSRTSDERWLAMVREGAIRVRGVRREAICERLQATGMPIRDLSQSLDIIDAGGASPETVDAFVAAASAMDAEVSEESEDRGRSSAERFLFGLLESMPQTVGLFQLNHRLEFRHGTSAAEADLLSVDHKLVIEVDGSYYHLSSKDAYRRDRRKDWLFQQHGYVVLRFLADDVVRLLEEILTTILAALELRRAGNLSQQGPAS